MSKYVKVISARAPVRIDFGGGGTDLEHYFRDGKTGYVVNTAIDRFVRTIAHEREDGSIKIISNDQDVILQKNSIGELTYNTPVDLVTAIIKVMKPEIGLNLFIESDIPPKSGLGASASLSTSVIAAINELTGNKLSQYEIAETGYIAEHDELKNQGGRQDQYVSVFGGFNEMNFTWEHNKANVKVSKLNIKKSFLDYLNNNMILFYTGITHTSGNIIDHQVKAYEKKDKESENIEKVKEMALGIRDALLSEDFNGLAQLVDNERIFKTKYNPHIITHGMELLDKIAKENGALGSRICGAGGGGCMIWVCKEGTSKQVNNALANAGTTEKAKEIPYNFNPKGYEITQL